MKRVAGLKEESPESKGIHSALRCRESAFGWCYSKSISSSLIPAVEGRRGLNKIHCY